MNRWLRLPFCLTAALVCVGLPTGHAANDWHVVKVGGWDYLTVDNVAKFYGFPGEVTPINKTIRLNNGKNQLEVTLDSREAIVNGVRNWLCFPILPGPDGKYLISRIDLAKTIEPQFRPQMIRNLGRIKTVVIDPGHGGVEKGAGSSYGNEKDFTLDVGLKLRPLLEAKGLKVIMTRDHDELVPLQERARIANATRDSIFVSIHFNATDMNGSATGFEIYSLTPRGAPSTQDNSLLERFINVQNGSAVDANSLSLSTAVYHAMLGYLPEFDRGVKRARFAVLRLTTIPAILIEGGFLTERQESRLIAHPEWREKLALAISVGIENYRALLEHKQRPMLLADYRRHLEGELVARNEGAAPVDGTAPIVYPATNQLAPAPSAQFTSAMREEPSEQMSLNDAPVAVAEHAGTTPPPMVEGAAPAVLGPPPEVFVAATEAAAPSPEEAGVMPEAAEESAVPAPPAPNETYAFTVQPAVQATPVPVVTRKYWVLKIPPTPKFRQ